MGTVTRWLQLLLDEGWMGRLERMAAARGSAGAGLARGAIGVALPDLDAVRRRGAVERFLAAAPMPVEQDWQAMKRADRSALLNNEGP